MSSKDHLHANVPPWAGERLFANKINPKKKGFQCSLTHIFQHFLISVLPLCPIITFHSCFRNCPGFLIFIAKFDGFSTMWAMLLCCLHERAPQKVKVAFPFVAIICFLIYRFFFTLRNLHKPRYSTTDHWIQESIKRFDLTLLSEKIENSKG